MGFLSSLFNFGDKPTTSSSNVIPKYPEELKPYIEEAMKDTQEIYKQRLGEGYQPYGGQTIAGFTPEEIASQQGLKSLVGTQAPLQQEALDLSRIASREFTPEVAQQYMSPYLRTALDAQKVEAQRQYERTKVPQFEADAVAAGGMSGLGTRAAVESAERATGQNRLLANIEAAGQQQAFEDAQNIFKDQTARERQSAAQISTAAPNIFKSALSEQGLLQTMGEQKRDLAQSALDEAYLKYVEEQQFPEQQLGRYQSSIYGNPLLKQPSYNTTGTKTGGGPGFGKTLLGLGTAALGFGTGGGSTIGGSLFNKFGFGAKGGGGIASTMKAQPYVQYMNRRAVGGSVLNPHDGKVTTFEEYNRAEREAEAVAQAVAGLQQESSPVLSTPASAVATAPAPAMASAAPTGLLAAMPPAAMPPAAMPPAAMPPAAMPPAAMAPAAGIAPPAPLPVLGGDKEYGEKRFQERISRGKAQFPNIPSEYFDSVEYRNHVLDPNLQIVSMVDMPTRYFGIGSGQAAAASDKAFESWLARTGTNYTGPVADIFDEGLSAGLRRTDGTENQPMPEPEYTYDKSRGGFKDVNGELTIDPETSMYGWLDDDDGPYFDQQAFLADAYNTNISGGVQGRLGRGNFIDKTEDEDDEGNYFNTYGLRISPRHTTFGPWVNPWPDLEGPWDTSVSGGLQSLNRRGGGRVMPPVMYRQQAGPVMPTGTVTRDEIGNVVSPSNMSPTMATDQQDFDTQYASDIEKGGETPYGLSGLDSATDESAFAQPLAPTVDKPTTLTPLSSDQSGAATLDNAFKMIGDKLTIDFPALTAGVRKQYTDDNITSEKEIVALNKESSDFQKRSIARIDKYKNDVISLIGNDPNENRNFWFTVAAAIMKPGNAWANLAQGLKEATLASSASREKKNKLLMMISKDEMNFKNDLDKIGSASTRSSIKLTAKQERTLNSLPKAIRDEAIRLMAAGASYNNAMAAAAKASGVTPSEMRKLASLDKGVRININKQAAQAFGFTLDNEGDFQGTDAQKKLYERQTKPIIALYNKMMLAYGSTKNRVEGQKRADKVLFDHSRKGTRPPSPDSGGKNKTYKFNKQGKRVR